MQFALKYSSEALTTHHGGFGALVVISWMGEISDSRSLIVESLLIVDWRLLIYR